MTISSTVRIAGPFTGNGVTTTFPFTYKVFSTADVQVVRLTISTGVETTLTLVTDYNITLNGNQNSNPGGSIVLVTPLLALYTLTATSNIANLQPTDLTNQGGFYPEVITDALDRATIQIQQMSDDVTRSIKAPLSDDLTTMDMTLPVVADRINKLLAFGATGMPTAIAQPPSSITGNTNIVGTLDVTGATTLSSTLGVTGNFAVNTSKFTANASTGNVVTDGTFTAINGVAAASLTSKIQPITASVAASALTITLNPTILDFRSSSLTSGTVTSIVVPTSISLTIPSTSTMGTISAVQSRIVVLAINNAGTVELAAVNMAGNSTLDETTLITTTAAVAAGNSRTAYYSTAVRTGVAYRVVGYVESTQATAGTWATAPSTIQGMGGQALTAMSSLGYGQNWQTVTRNAGTTYYNTTGKPIAITMVLLSTASQGIQFSVNSVLNLYVAATVVGSAYYNFTNIIPANASYKLESGTFTIYSTTELR